MAETETDSGETRVPGKNLDKNNISVWTVRISTVPRPMDRWKMRKIAEKLSM